jgi:hemolysin activation/secretion protein
MTSLAGPASRAFLLLSVPALATAAQAQVAPPPAASVPPPTREEVQRVPTAPLQAPPSRLTVEGGIERAPCPLAEPRFADVTVTISEVVFDHLRGADPASLKAAYADYVGKTVPIAAVCEIRDAAATILRRQGYLAAVQVPAQRIENGVIHFDVLMAKLVSVQVRGDAGRSERIIAGYLGKLSGQEVFNQREAERYLLLARDLPGFDVRLVLRPAGTVPGEVIGEVKVTKVPFTIDANVQNYGSHDVGRWGGIIRGEFYDILGGDRLIAGLFSTADRHEQQVVQLGYDIKLGSEGLTLGGRYTQAWTTPDLGSPAQNQFESRTKLASLEASYPVLRTQATNLRAAVGFDVVNQETLLTPPPSPTAMGRPSITVNKDKLRVFYARLDFEAIDRASIGSTVGYSLAEPRWRLAGSLEARKGADIFDATPSGSATLSRAGANTTAALVRFQGTAEYRPGPGLALAVSPRAQYTGSALASFEQYSAGNYTIGRGYDPGSVIGDSGVGFQAEIRVGSLQPRAQNSFAFQPYVFLDQAWVWSNNRSLPPLDSTTEDLTSTGIGVRATYGTHARLDMTLAKPLQPVATAPGLPATKGDVRLLVSLTTKLIPW